MSGPVSLRLCCLAAMAPALTEATGHSRLELKNNSAPACIDDSISETAGVKCKSSVSNTSFVADSIASGHLKIVNSISNLKQRGLLKPLNQENITDKLNKLKTDKVANGITDLKIIKNIPAIIKQLSSEKGQTDCVSDHIYPRFCDKMNQPSNGNGPNGTGKKFFKHSLLADENRLNGHTQNRTDISQAIKLSGSGVTSNGHINSNKAIQPVSSTEIPEMCHSTELPSTSGTMPLVRNQIDSKITSDKTTKNGRESINQRQSLDQPCPEVSTQDLIKDASRKEFLLERRSQFLIRRLRRIQGKQLEVQVHDQLKSFAEFQHQNLQSVASRAIRPFGDLQSSFFSSNDVKNLSTSNLVSLVRKLQSSQQKAAVLNPKKSSSEGKGVLVMEQGISAESERKSRQMKTNVGHWNFVVDSEATESSSGGESCEEWEDCPVMEEDKKIPIPLYKRADWKWSVDRAAIISRWTWLQAQVSDLEYRIRQQKEIYKTIRSSKGVVTLGEMQSGYNRFGDTSVSCEKKQESPANVTTLMINVNKQASKLSQSLGNCLSPLQSQGLLCDKVNDVSLSKSLNGFIDGSLGGPASHTQVTNRVQCMTPVTTLSPSGDSAHVTRSPDLGQPLDATCVAARCRPVRFYRKRKLLRTAGLHQVNHKAARLSTVKCQCFPPEEWCPLCGGRYNNVQKLDTEGMAVMDKVALLDQAYHPVLSFPQEIALPIHFEALLKSGEWQTVKPPPKATLRAMAAEKRRQKLLNAHLKDQARKNRKKSAVLLTSAKLRSKYEGKSPHNSPKKRLIGENRLRRKELKRRRVAQLAAAAQRKNGYGSYHDTDQDSLGTPSPSPLSRDNFLSLSGQSGSLKEAKEMSMRKKRFENAYDINNIVIPYSMAAATRVEKLQYKEIQTPKWRELPMEENNKEKMNVDEKEESEIEDVSDEAFTSRHQTFEEEERKRIRSFITYPPVRRARQSRESESQSVDYPPTETIVTDNFIENEGYSAFIHNSSALLNREEGRRRSGSTSRRMSGLEDGLIDFEINRAAIEPWTERAFPLTEECYEDMKQEQIAAGRATGSSYTRTRVVKVLDDDMEFVSPERSDSPAAPDSPHHSYSSGSTLDDLNDPEWHGERRKDRRPSGNGRHSRR